MKLFFRMFSRFAIPALTAALVATATAEAGAQQSRRTDTARIDTTYTFNKNGAITVSAESGDVVITGWARDQIRIHAESDENDIRFETTSDRMTLGIAGGRRHGDTRFEVTVPYGVRVDARTQSGDISVRGTHGAVDVHAQSGDIRVDDVVNLLGITTVSGDVTAANVNGDVAISTISGDVTLTDARGTIDAASVSGSIVLREITSRLVRGKTTSGDVTYDGTIDRAGRYDLTSHSGDISLHIPRDADAQLTVSTWNGGIDSQFPITVKPGEHVMGSGVSKHITFQIGGGSARINVETFNGDITISSNGRGASGRP